MGWTEAAWARVLRVLAAGAVVLTLAGCAAMSPAAQRERSLQSSLAALVEDAQEDLWAFREQLLADPEATIPEIWYVADARPAYTDPTAEVGDATYRLLGLASNRDRVALTLLTSSAANSGGGLFYETTEGSVCFTLVFPAGAPQITTEASDCSDENGRLFPGLTAPEVNLVSVDDLDVRRSVDESDFPPLPCQCHSGGTCDCPGG